jgi:pimeloyl-ACP methyl ester carboxylesterase
MGGLVISRAAELRPAKIGKLVYIAAFLLPSGATILETTSTEANARAMTGLVLTEDGSAASVKAESIRHTFYADCEDCDVALARTLLVPQALAVSVTPLSTTDENWGRVPRFYIECTYDNAIPIEAQRAMVSRLPCRRVITMETSHSPFFASPGELSAHLLQLLV